MIKVIIIHLYTIRNIFFHGGLVLTLRNKHFAEC